MVQQGGSMKELIGKKIKGFKFKADKNIAYFYNMNNHIGKVGVIREVFDECVRVKFDDNNYYSYPLPEALNHIVEEHPQRGDEVLIWDGDETDAVKRIFLAYIEGANYPINVVTNGYEENFKNGETFATSKYRHYKTIPQKTKLTMQQIADKFGIDVNYLEIENYER